MTPIKLALNAMATRFELVLHGENATRTRATGEAALKEVEPSVFRLLRHARQLQGETGGAFDITVAPLVRCWGFMHGTGRLPEPAEIAAVRACSGMAHVQLDEENYSVRFDQEGVMIDLGAIGKGYAVDCAVETLREAGVASALLHGGTSTVYGLGSPPDAEGWKIAIAAAPGQPSSQRTVVLRDHALSVSAVWGKSFEADGRKFGHVIDPRTGWPVNNAVQAAVALPSATETDALSTALLVLGLEGHQAISQLRPDMRTLVMAPAEQGFLTASHGMEVYPS
jgi:thiamine biosynthesis lipoprotein